MEQVVGFLDTGIGVLATIGGFLTLAVVGLLAVFGKIDRENIKRLERYRELTEKTEDKIVATLEQRISQLEEKILEQQKQINDMTVRLNEAEARNKFLEDLFAGRDKDSVQLRKEAKQAIPLIKKNNEYNQQILESMEKLLKQLNKNEQRVEKCLTEIVKALTANGSIIWEKEGGE